MNASKFELLRHTPLSIITISVTKILPCGSWRDGYSRFLFPFSLLPLEEPDIHNLTLAATSNMTSRAIPHHAFLTSEPWITESKPM
jgi:hypothetical protein